MRKLIWCAAAGAVAAGSAWATVYAWNQQEALLRGQLVSSCVVGLLNRAPTTTKAPHAETASGDSVGAAASGRSEAEIHPSGLRVTQQVEEPAWVQVDSGVLPRANGDVEQVPDLHLSMPIVIHEAADQPESKGDPSEEERAAVLEQLRPLLREITTAEIQSGSDPVVVQGMIEEDTSVCSRPMAYCEDEDAPVASPPVMPYADEEPVAEKVLFDVSQLIWSVPFLGSAEVQPEDMLKLVEEVAPEIETNVQDALHDYLEKVQVPADVTPRVEEGTDVLPNLVSLVRAWLGGVEAEETTEPEETPYHHSQDLSCPYSGCPYPGPSYYPPAAPVEENKEKKPENESSEAAQAVGVIEQPLLRGFVTEISQIPVEHIRAEDEDSWKAFRLECGGQQGPDTFNTVPAQFGFSTAQGYAPPDDPMPLPIGNTRLEDGGVYLVNEIVLYRETHPLGDHPLQEIGLVTSSMVQKVKEILADYVHMVRYEQDAYSEYEAPHLKVSPKNEVAPAGSSRVDTTEFRPSDHASYVYDGTGPF